MKKILISTTIIFLFFSCSNGDNKKNNQNEDIVKTDLNQDDLGEYTIIKVSDRPDERIVRTQDRTLSEISTTRLKDKSLITIFNGDLGSFGQDHDFEMVLQFTRVADDPKLKVGTYNIVTLGDDKHKLDECFQCIITDQQTYDNIILSGMLDDFQDEFYLPFDDKNILVIESTEDLGETENSSPLVSENFQRVKGYIEFKIFKIKTNKEYKLHVEFNLINAIRIFATIENS